MRLRILGQRHLVVGVPVGVVVVGNLLRVRESGEPITARGTGAGERLVQDELAGVGLRRARRRAVEQAVGVVLLLVVHHVVVANPNSHISRPEYGTFVLEAFEVLVGVDHVLLRRIRRVDVEEDLRACTVPMVSGGGGGDRTCLWG